jgi:hypothetical protein
VNALATAMVREAEIPSRRQVLLRAAEGATLRQLTRYTWMSRAEFVDSAAPDQMFATTGGPVVLAFSNGVAIGASSQPSLISVVVWDARLDDPAADDELVAIDAADPELSSARFASLVGKRLIGSEILIRDAKNAKWVDRPREAGVVLRFEGDAALVLSHGLHDDSDDFSVLTWADVAPALRGQLHPAAA